MNPALVHNLDISAALGEAVKNGPVPAEHKHMGKVRRQALIPIDIFTRLQREHHDLMESCSEAGAAAAHRWIRNGGCSFTVIFYAVCLVKANSPIGISPADAEEDVYLGDYFREQLRKTPLLLWHDAWFAPLAQNWLDGWSKAIGAIWSEYQDRTVFCDPFASVTSKSTE